MAVYDAPVGWLNRSARIALVGITPGFAQMEIAYRAVRRHLLAGATPDDACRSAKYEASFGGPMRRNLVRMLDDLGISEHLAVSSAEDLFGFSGHLLHTTSAVRHPTFVGGTNYTGSRPPLGRSVFLMQYVRELLAPELSMLEDAVFVPLGKSVLTVLEILEAEGRIPKDRAPYGFPHPSGANGHRARQFEEARFAMRTRLDQALRR